MEDKSAQQAASPTIEAEPTTARRRRGLKFMPQDKSRLYFLLLLLALSILLLIVTIIGKYTDTFWIVSLGAVFALGLIGSVSPVWPLPGSLACFLFASLGLNPVLAAVAAGIAEPIGLIVYYTGGYRVAKILAKIKGYSRVESWMIRRGGTTALFLSCAIPGPWNKPAAAIVGSAKYPLVKFYLICFAGTTIKCLGYAFAGYFVFKAVS
jgi:membrane protein DedA with SNARE-associated domain